MGYFNLTQIKASYPESAAATSLEERAKDMLRRDVDKANAEITEMTQQNKPKEEIEKRSKELQLEIASKQQALASLLSSNSQEANRAIAQAAASVAKEKGLDIVIDASGIYAGGDKFANNGEDVTEAVLRRLVPGSKPAEAAH
jgi:Skp family chaperone for outer membrane proteins